MHAIQLPCGHSQRKPCLLKQLLVNEPLHRWWPGGQPRPGQLEQRRVGPQSQVLACAGLAPTASAASPVAPPTTTRRSASLRFTRRAIRSLSVPIRSSPPAHPFARLMSGPLPFALLPTTAPCHLLSRLHAPLEQRRTP